MKHSALSSLSVLSLLIGTLSLAGCGGASSFSNPVTSETTPPPPGTPQSVAGPAVQGSVFGGHAPIENAHVYLAQPGTSGYGSLATSLLGNNGATTAANGYTLTANTGSDPNVPVGAKYVTTNANGEFFLTGAYNCVAGQPVYIYAYGGKIAATALNNNNIVQLATLGNCPSSGNFSTAGNGALQYVYLNEVSTVATAYTFQPFTLATNNDAWHIGTGNTTQGLLGIANAANTAAQLYSIQGQGAQSTCSGTACGEGHVANYRTVGFSYVGGNVTFPPNAGNGVVPEATIDSLANILADCVDSTVAAVGTTTAQCVSLFKLATNDGSTSPTGMPVDTGTAAINIARFPAGNHSATTVDSTYAADIYALQASGPTPYLPQLSHAPNDWTIAINYPYSRVGGYTTTNADVELAESVQVDQLGQIWITAQAGGNGSTNPSPSADRWSPLGVVNAPNGSPGNYIFGYVSIDGGNNAWTGSATSTTGIYYAGSNGSFSTTYGNGAYTDAYTVIANNAGDAFFFAQGAGTGTNYGMWEYLPGGTLAAGSPFNISDTTTTGTGPVTQNLNITAASETNSGGTYTYSFNFTNVGGTPPTVLAVGDTVPLTLANDPGTGGTPVAGTGWQNLTSVTVASVNSTTNPTSFTATGTIPTTNSNDGNGAATTAGININTASATNSGGTYTYTFGFTTVGTPTVPLAVGDVVPVTLTNDPGTGTTPVAATGWNNLHSVTVATVNSTTNPTSFTATGTSVVTNTVSTNANGPTVSVPITSATETHAGGNYTYTFAFTPVAGKPALAVGDVVPLALTNASGTGTPQTPGTGWTGLTSVTVASVNPTTNPTSFTATGTTATTNASSTATINITAATETHTGGTYTYTFTYNTVGTPTALAAGNTVNLTLANAGGSTGWTTLHSVVVNAGVTGTTFTATGTTATTNPGGFGNHVTGTGTYTYSSTGATGTATYHINGATGTGSYVYANANGATGTGSYVYTGTVTTFTPGGLAPGTNVAHGAIDSAGDFWITSEAGDSIARITPTGTPVFPRITVSQQPEFPAIDGSGNAWIPGYETNSIYQVTPSGTLSTFTSTNTGAALVYPFGSAVDGNGNIWITNRCGPGNICGTYANSRTLVEINGGVLTPGTANKAISPPTNYLPEAQYPATATTFSAIMGDPLNLAIDPSGNIWVTNYNFGGNSSVTEIVGAAAPVVTPLSLAAGTNSLGAKP